MAILHSSYWQTCGILKLEHLIPSSNLNLRHPRQVHDPRLQPIQDQKISLEVQCPAIHCLCVRGAHYRLQGQD